MRINKAKIEDFPIKMECKACSDPLVLIAAHIEEGFNQPSVARIEFVSDTPNIDLDKLMGQKITLTSKVPDGPDRLAANPRERKHVGICTEARFVGNFEGACHYWAEIRPKMWILSLNRDCRVFQEKTAPDIIKEVLGDYGVTIDEQFSDSYPTRITCVQYRETDLDFIHRLMEEEGMFYYFEHDGGEEKMVVHDDSAALSPVPCDDMIRYMSRDDQDAAKIEHFFEWQHEHKTTTGKYTHTDYNFETPKAKLESFRSLAKGKHDLKNREVYDFPGHYKVASDGDRYSRIKMEELAIRYQTWRGTGIVSNIEVGGVFKIKDHPATKDSEEFVVQAASHMFQLNERELNTLEVTTFPSGSVREAMRSSDPYQVQVTAIPKQEKFRPAPVTPWPSVTGIQTAVVTGPAGEEIYTDQYGRIRIQFHWDRLGEKNENSTCWVRCMMPWASRGFGAHFWPRIGDEVVVDFLEGNPDEPMVVGVVYNADNMPPYDLPANQSRSGIKTRSTKEGSTDNFNELRFEDKKGSEEIYFHSEKDYNQVVENNATITIGADKKDKGDLTQEIYHDKTEEIGNNSTVKIGYGEGGKNPGDMKHEVFNDRTEVIGNNFKVNVQKGNHETTVEMGDQSNKVSMGNMTNEVSMGNFTETIKMGNHTTKVNLGKTEHTAMQSIELKVGGSSIKIDPSGVTIKGPMIKLQAQAMAQVQAPMVKINGSGMVMLQGGLIKIN